MKEPSCDTISAASLNSDLDTSLSMPFVIRYQATFYKSYPKVPFFSSPSLLFVFALEFLPAATKLGQGNVFTGVCDSVNRGGGLPQCMLGYHHHPLRTPPPGADTPPEQIPLRNRPPQSRHPPREADSGIRSTSGQYASYWNAFL